MTSERASIGVVAGLLVPLAACAANAPYASFDASPGLGDSGVSAPDATLSDAGFAPADAGADGSTVQPPTREDNAAACADFVDDDHNGVTDCADTANCGTEPICCVGSTEARCCAPPATLTPVVSLTGCTTGLLADCAAGMLAFGAPLPVITDTRNDGGSCTVGSVLAPQGSDRGDGGLLAMASLDTTAGVVVLESTLGVTVPSAASLDAIAVGLTTQSDLASMSVAHVRPVVAIVVSSTDQTVRAVAGDIAFPTHALAPFLVGAGGCSDLEVRIVTSPSGTFDALVRAAGAPTWMTLESGRPYGPVLAAHVVAYGRSTNPGADGVHAWLRSIGVGRTVCDVLDPSRASTGAFTPLPMPGHAIHSVSRVDGRAVYEMDGAIYVAGVDGNGRLVALNRPGVDGDRILAPGGSPFMAAALADPELVAIDENRRLLFTGIAADGTRSIGYVDFDTDVLQRVQGSVPHLLLSPSDIHSEGPDGTPGPATVLGVDGPAYVTTQDEHGATHRFLVFRAIVDATHSELRGAELIGDMVRLGTDFESPVADASNARFYTSAAPLRADAAFYANRTLDAVAFDHDEIAAPEVIAYRNVIRVFFAARRGARWTIGVLRSPDFAHFERAYEGPILAGSGGGFDAVSVSDPDVVVDANGELTLYYTASDGTSTQPGLATQEVPTP